VLSAGITCPKHGWSFDLFSGTGDRGQYQLSVWEVQLRPVSNADALRDAGRANEEVEDEREVWVRRKQRIG
jgi:nitrite reductase/ring-hydroxylating ferredoxin subunit